MSFRAELKKLLSRLGVIGPWRRLCSGELLLALSEVCDAGEDVRVRSKHMCLAAGTRGKWSS